MLFIGSFVVVMKTCVVPRSADAYYMVAEKAPSADSLGR